jgi:tRNA-Thr(GGU) m(6)t(6)A37 methyltransferase TsaA
LYVEGIMTAEDAYRDPNSISLQPIGEVRNGITDLRRHDWDEVVSELVMSPELEEALSDVEGFSHVIVVFWMHKTAPLTNMPAKVHPRGRRDRPLVGLFATRAPYRPNAVGVSVVKVLERRGSVILVEGLDAVDGTPIVDIKPYLPRYDSPQDVGLPEWAKKGDM